MHTSMVLKKGIFGEREREKDKANVVPTMLTLER